MHLKIHRVRSEPVNRFASFVERCFVYYCCRTQSETTPQVNKLAENALESLEYADWPLAARIKLGAALIKYLLESASWSEDGRPAFIHEVRSTKVRRRHGVVAMDSAVYNKVRSYRKIPSSSNR